MRLLIHRIFLAVNLLAAGLAGLWHEAGYAAQEEKEPQQAQNTTLLETSVEDLLGMEVYSAARFPQARAEAPSALTIITAEEISLYGYRSLDEILRAVPGIHISYDRVYKYLGIRGLRRPQDFNSPMLLLVDGHRLNDGIYDSAPIGEDFPLDVELIERVEFVRGPGSAVYGSNALFGVINVVTRNPAQSQTHRLHASIGDAEAHRALAQTDVPLGDNAALLLSASYADRVGRDVYVPAFDAPETNNGIAKDLDGDQRRRFMATLTAGDWRFQWVHGDRRKDVPLPIYGADFNDSRNNFRDLHGFYNLSYRTGLDDDWSLQARVSNSYDRYQGNLAYDGVLNLDSSNARRWGAETRLLFEGWPSHRLMAGIELAEDYRQDQLNFDEPPGTVVLDVPYRSQSHGLFVQDEWQLRDNLRLTTGLRHDRRDEEEFFAPRAALVYQPTYGHSLKLLFAKAARAPSVYERFYAVEGYSANPDVGIERSTNYDLLWEAYPTASLRLQLGLQHFKVQDFIVEGVEAETGNIQYVNGKTVRSSGIDLDVEKFWGNGWQTRASFSLQHARRAGGEEVIDAPDVVYKFFGSAPVPGSIAKAALEIQGINERHSAQGHAPGYALLNLTLSQLRLCKNLHLAASVYNLFDKEYADPLSLDLSSQGVDQATVDGREFRISLDWSF